MPRGQRVRKVKTTRTFKKWCRRKNKKFTLHSRVSIARIRHLWLKKYFQEWASKKIFDQHVSCRTGPVTANQHIFKSGLIKVIFIDTKRFDVFCISETYLNSSITEDDDNSSLVNETIMTNSNFFKKRFWTEGNAK